MAEVHSTTAYLDDDLVAEAAARADARVHEAAAVEPQIRYPSYKSFDPFIDVAALCALDGYMMEQLKRHARDHDDHRFYTGPYRRDVSDAGRAGSRMIYLSESNAPDSYFDLDKPERWATASAADQFVPLMEFIQTLPFRQTGRMIIIYDDVARAGPAHRDHIETDICHEFIWFRTNLTKRFYMADRTTGARKYVESHSAWFDTVNQFHGSDAHEGLSFSVRVDGVFTDSFRCQIPFPEYNRASAPALWASGQDTN